MVGPHGRKTVPFSVLCCIKLFGGTQKICSLTNVKFSSQPISCWLGNPWTLTEINLNWMLPVGYTCRLVKFCLFDSPPHFQLCLNSGDVSGGGQMFTRKLSGRRIRNISAAKKEEM